MKTIVHIELNDKDRAKIGKMLGLGHMVTRKELTEAVERHVEYLIKGKVEEDAVFAAKKILDEKEIPKDVKFTPSRGDEAYLTRPKDPELAATCSRILDDVAIVEAFVWETIERNRKK